MNKDRGEEIAEKVGEIDFYLSFFAVRYIALHLLCCHVGNNTREGLSPEHGYETRGQRDVSAVGGREVATSGGRREEDERGGREERPQAIKTFAPR